MGANVPACGSKISSHHVIGAEHGAVGEPVGRVDHDTMRVRTGGGHLRRTRLDPPGHMDRIDDQGGIGVRRQPAGSGRSGR